MLSGVDWLAFLPAAFVLSLVPGANQTLSLRNGMVHGARPAALAVGGRFVAFAAMIALVAVGLGAVLARSEAAFALLKWVGAAYVAYLGVRTLLGAGSAVAEPGADGAPGPAAPVGRLFRQELLVAASNPKAIIIFAVFLRSSRRPGRTRSPSCSSSGSRSASSRSRPPAATRGSAGASAPPA